MICSECFEECETYTEDLSFDYAGTHCTGGLPGTHNQTGDDLSKCCDAEPVDLTEEIEFFMELRDLCRKNDCEWFLCDKPSYYFNDPASENGAEEYFKILKDTWGVDNENND